MVNELLVSNICADGNPGSMKLLCGVWGDNSGDTIGDTKSPSIDVSDGEESHSSEASDLSDVDENRMSNKMEFSNLFE